MDIRSYYDTMSRTYETERDRGYHAFLDDAEVSRVADLVRGRRVLEVGTGTGLLLQRFQALASQAVGIDLSPGMLEKAAGRGLDVVLADALALPFPDASFDGALCFKVLAHIPDVRAAIAEMTRVVKPGGFLALEFYNRHSLRALVKRVKPPTAIGGSVSDTDVYTRFDGMDEIRSYLPPDVFIESVHGIRIALPFAAPMTLPGLGSLLRLQEKMLSATPLSRFGGFLVVSARKQPTRSD